MGTGLGRTATLAAAAAAVALLAAGCGEEEELDVVEGEPVELGDLRYNVQITRFLNPDDPEDVAYLEGEPKPSAREAYLGVFMTIENEGEETVDAPASFEVTDTRGGAFESLEVDNPYALDLGAPIGPGQELPPPGTPASSGPIKGAMLLFLVDQGVTENRPLELEIPSSSGDGRVELDI
jgi:hypothetical protein